MSDESRVHTLSTPHQPKDLAFTREVPQVWLQTFLISQPACDSYYVPKNSQIPVGWSITSALCQI
jgi:hypothetical protein